MDVGTVVTLVTARGEIVGRFEAYDERYITLSRPRMSSGNSDFSECAAEDFSLLASPLRAKKDPRFCPLAWLWCLPLR